MKQQEAIFSRVEAVFYWAYGLFVRWCDLWL